MSISDIFEKMIDSNEMSWEKPNLNFIEPFGRMLLKVFVEQAKINWQIAKQKIGSAYVIKLDDEFLQYLDVFPDSQEYMWCIDNHHDSVHPDVASEYLIRKSFPGIETDLVIDNDSGNSVLRLKKDDSELTIVDIREQRFNKS